MKVVCKECSKCDRPTSHMIIQGVGCRVSICLNHNNLEDVFRQGESSESTHRDTTSQLQGMPIENAEEL